MTEYEEDLPRSPRAGQYSSPRFDRSSVPETQIKKPLSKIQARKAGNGKSSLPPRLKNPVRQLRPGDKARKPRSGSEVAYDELYEAFVQGWGRIGRAAEYLGCSRETTRMALRRYPELQQAVEEGEQLYTDTLEQVTLEEASLDRDSKRDTLRMFLLKKRKPKVYADRQDDSTEIMQQALKFVLNKSKNPAEYKPDSN
jgi:hypothetical protein